jgi:pimeloyl-ACP methyl ester carboxylesterase
MKTIEKWMVAATLICGAPAMLNSCKDKDDTNTESSGDSKSPNYSQKACWWKIPEITKEFDTFYIYSTIYFGANEGDPDYATLDNREMLDGIKVEHAIKSSVFEESTNLFIPLYRQSSLKHAAEAFVEDGHIDNALIGTPYSDITAALDYYFEHYNQGRPFIIAGHSQGAAILRLLLKRYFKEHPDRYERMVAAYAIGYSITKEDLEANPHMKFATGETDTGVIICYNSVKDAECAHSTDGRENAVCINPVNWRTDSVPATVLTVGSPWKPAAEQPVDTLTVHIDPATNFLFVSGYTGNDHVLPLMGCEGNYHSREIWFYRESLRQNIDRRQAAFRSR